MAVPRRPFFKAMCSSSHLVSLPAQSNFPSIFPAIWFYNGLCCSISQISDFFPFCASLNTAPAFAHSCPHTHSPLRPPTDEKWIARHKSTASFFFLFFPVGNLSFPHTHISQEINTSLTEEQFIKRFRRSNTKNLSKPPYCIKL